ncbi:MAG: alpha/beta hydrolase [Acidimicrobiales bacterium]
MRRMRRLLPVVAGLALLASSAGCHYPPGTRYVDQVFDEVTVTSNVVYRTTTNYLGQTVNLQLDIYEPVDDTAAQRATVMWMHGGGWTFGDKSLMTAYAEDSARRGYVAVSINYRLRDATSVPAALDAYEDALAAVQWLKDHAAQYRIDPEAIIVGGHSAGAINAAHVLFLPATSPAAGGVSLAGLTFGAPTAGDPPLIVHHGTADNIVPYVNGSGMCTETRDAGNVCDLFTYEDQGHLIPYQEPAATDIKNETAHSIMDRVLEPLGYPVEQPG